MHGAAERHCGNGGDANLISWKRVKKEKTISWTFSCPKEKNAADTLHATISPVAPKPFM